MQRSECHHRGTNGLRIAAAFLFAAGGLAGCGSHGADRGASGSGDRVAIRVAGGDGATAATPFFAAIKQGFFKDAGLDVSYVTLAGGATSMDAAIKSSAIDVGIGGATQWISDAAKGAVEGKMIGEIADNNYVILGGNGISNVAQLKGRIFGVSNYNAGDHLYSKAVLARFGVPPESVTWLAIGNPGGRLAALKAGKIAATEMPLTNLPPDKSLNVIVGADDSPFPFVSNGIFARQGFLTANRDALRKFLGAIGKGAEWVRSHPTEAVSSCEDSGADADTCKAAIAAALSSKNPYTWSSTAALNADAIRTMIPIVAQVVPEAKKLSIADVADTSLARLAK